MLFNSYSFIFIFFPLVLLIYFVLNHRQYDKTALAFLFIASLFFYGYWNPRYLPLILLSILVNYGMGVLISKYPQTKRTSLIIGIFFNLALLSVYKYSQFLVENINQVLHTHLIFPAILLPLGISFFTFTQIAYLVDTYAGRVKERNFLSYGLFVTFFPHLLAGPIIHHAEIMPQFSHKSNKTLNYQNIVLGLTVFSLGLFKKTCIADTLAIWVNNGYDHISLLTTPIAWLVSLSYSLQLYFDFSGYTDMAIGTALMLNITLPENFNSPYKALNIQDFWRRWHMTLSRWLRDYLYIPLGGNQGGVYATHRNILLTFVLGGLWHGAGWTYVIWGFMHGAASVIHRFWKLLNIELPKFVAWFITFMFVNLAWVFFRADSLKQAFALLTKMFSPVFVGGVSLKNTVLQNIVPDDISQHPKAVLILFPLFMLLALKMKNSSEIKLSYQPTIGWNLWIASIFTIGILSLVKVSTYIYFQF